MEEIKPRFKIKVKHGLIFGEKKANARFFESFKCLF